MGRTLRVFISSTSELNRYPHKHDSYVEAAREAVQQAEHVVEHMTLWGAHEAPPAKVCSKQVRACDVYVGVVGHRYGSVVPDDSQGRSYTQFEFDTAGDAGKPRLVFLLGDRLETPYDKEVFTDASHGDLQAAFRKAVLAQTTAVTVASPEDLKFAVYKSLRELGEVAAPDRRVEAPTYLAGLTDHDRERLQEINREGLAYLRARLDEADAVAVVGPGASAGLYPVWPDLVARLLDEAPLLPEDRDRVSLLLSDRPAAALAALRQVLDRPSYLQGLGGIFQQRRDSLTGRRYTRVQAAVVRRPFKGVIATSPDPGLRLARNALRTDSTTTSFATWESTVQLDRWTSASIFTGAGLPLLFSHGDEHRPAGIVLDEADHTSHGAHGGSFGDVVDRLVRRLWTHQHLCWVGFPASDPRLERARKAVFGPGDLEPGRPAVERRHVVLVPWDPSALGQSDPSRVHDAMVRSLNAHAVLYPAPGGNHSALADLLESLPPYAPAPSVPRPGTADKPPPLIEWAHRLDTADDFVGRQETLNELDRYAGDDEVRLIAVTAWGGAGKTSVVSEWLRRRAGRLRDGVRGVHVWSFYQSASGTEWAESVLAWIDDAFPEAATSGDLAHRLAHAARTVPLILVLDGLETMQAPPDSPAYGHVTGTPETGGDVVKRVVDELCRQDHDTLLIATSRFPLTDVQMLEGSSVRSIPLLRLTEQEGAELIERGGGGALSDHLRKKIVRALDGHALAVRTAARIAGTMTPGKHTIEHLLRDLLRATRDDERVEHVLITYAEQLPRADRMLVGVVSLFGRPVTPQQILAVGRSTMENGELSGWSTADVEQAARTRLRGTLTWHDDGTLSAHPLIRQTFRPYALSAAPQFEAIRRGELPSSLLTSPLDAESVLEIADVLVAADLLPAAHDLHETLAGGGEAWWRLPAVSVGDQTSWLFVASPEKRRLTAKALGTDACARYLVLAAALALGAGSIDVARRRIALAQASGAGAGRLRPAVELVLARMALTKGNVTEAELHAREAVAAATAARDVWGERLATAVLARTLFARAQADDVVQARATMAQALKVPVTGDPDGVYPGPVTVELWDAEMLGQLGDGARFEAALAAAQSAAAAQLPRRADLALCDLLRVAYAGGTPADLGRRRRILVESRTVLDGGGLTVETAECDLALARLDLEAGALGDAAARVESAHESAVRSEATAVRIAALALRARIEADVAAGATDAAGLGRAKSRAESALRQAREAGLPWLELDAQVAVEHVKAAAGTPEREPASSALAVRLRGSATPFLPREAPRATPRLSSETASSALALRLRDLRISSLGIVVTQRQLAEALGVSVPLISSWESATSPSLPPEDRLRSLALFFATPRSLDGPHPRVLDMIELTQEEERRRRELIDELAELREAALMPRRPEGSPLYGHFWSYPDGQPVRIIVPEIPWEDDRRVRFTDPWDPDHTDAFEYAAADAVVELVGHLRATNPGSDVRWLGLSQVTVDDLAGGHVVLLETPGYGLGGPLEYMTRRLDLPVHITMPEDGDRFHQAFVVTVDGEGRPDIEGSVFETYRPRFVEGYVSPRGGPALEYDVALLARAPNPLNLSATVTFAAGIFAAGTYGAVRSLTDATLRSRNEQFLTQSVDVAQFWLLMHVPVFRGPTGAQTVTPDLTRPYHRLRVSSSPTPPRAGGEAPAAPTGAARRTSDPSWR